LTFGKVLVIDDDADIRSLLRVLLEGWGLEVVTAENGVDGIALANDAQPMLILLDLNMPKLTGFETARKIRENPRTASIPILAVTAIGQAENRDEAHLAGCDAVVSKPIEATLLYKAVTRLIGQLHP
jgi:two-component system cell cycle response regulator DivK